MNGSVLVVCTANVCRSPLAALTLEHRLAGTSDGLSVSSAGTRAMVGAEMCSVSSEMLVPADRAAGAAHRARQLTPELVREADLVVVMERDHRSAAVRLAPGSQAKVFTLKEIAVLLPVVEERAAWGTARVTDLAAALHAARGLVSTAPSEPERRHWWSRPSIPVDPITIDDGHGLSDREHRTAIRNVVDATEEAASRIRSIDPGEQEAFTRP
jgi:protein-tyrosine phosphatase